MLLPDVDDAGRIVFVDYRPTHPSYAMLDLAGRGACLLEVRRDGHRFEAVITGLDASVVDSQLLADLMGAQRWLEARAADYVRAVRRLNSARRLIADAEAGCTLIRADFERYRLAALAAGDTPAARRPPAAQPWEAL